MLSVALLAEPSRVQAILLVGGVVVAALLLYLAGLDKFRVGTYFDDGRYIVLAKSIAAGQGYRLISYPDAPSELKFPPGYPLLLASVALLSPGSIDAFKIPSLLLTAGAQPLWFVVLRRRLPFSISLLALCAIATNPFLVDSATLAMSEALFLFLLGALLALGSKLDSGRAFSLRNASLLALIAVALYLVRIVGAAVVVSTTTYFLLHRQFKLALVVASLVVVPLALWTYSSAVTTIMPTEYQQELNGSPLSNSEATHTFGNALDQVVRVGLNARNYMLWGIPNYLQVDPRGNAGTSTSRRLLSQLHVEWLGALFPWTVGALVIVGLLTHFLIHFRWPPAFADLGLLAYAGALAVWPWAAPRFLEPVGPAVYMFLIVGVGWVAARLAPRKSLLWHRGLLATILVLLTTMNLALDVHKILVPIRERTTDIGLSTRWLVDNTPTSSVVMGEFSYVQSLYSNRHMVDFPSRSSIEDGAFIDKIHASKADYVLIAPPIQDAATTRLDGLANELQTALLQHPDQFQVVFDSPADAVQVFRVAHS